MSTINVIHQRRSCRSYDARPIAPAVLEMLRREVPVEMTGLFGSRMRFRWIDLVEAERDELKTLGTYGFIKGAKLYLAGVVAGGEMAMVDFGNAMEGHILKATALGLGTCWLGGTFRKGGFAKKLDPAPDEALPGITPVGYPAGHASLREGIIRFMAKSDRRKDWAELFFDGSPQKALTAAAAGPWQPAFECVRLAPSAANKQPWRVVMADDRKTVHFFLERTPGYQKIFKHADLQRVDMGIALCHFEIAASELGLAGQWRRLFPAGFPTTWNYIASRVGA